MLLLEAFANNGQNKVVTAIQLVGACGLAYVMYDRYASSGKVMPAGLVAFLSVGAVSVFGARLLGYIGADAAGHGKGA